MRKAGIIPAFDLVTFGTTLHDFSPFINLVRSMRKTGDTIHVSQFY